MCLGGKILLDAKRTVQEALNLKCILCVTKGYCQFFTRGEAVQRSMDNKGQDTNMFILIRVLDFKAQVLIL